MKNPPPCGTRAAYVARKCRCEACRKANRDYAQKRQDAARAAASSLQVPTSLATTPQVWTARDGSKKVRHYRHACPGVEGEACPTRSHLRKDSLGGLCGNCRVKLVANPLVPTERARMHLKALSEKGVGRRSVQDASDVAGAILSAIISGERKHIRLSTEKRILNVDANAVADGATVDGKPTWKRIRELLRWGYTRGEVAQELGNKTPALQLRKKRVLASTALKVERLHKACAEQRQKAEALDSLCIDCGLSHAVAERLERLRRALPGPTDELLERWPCVYVRSETLNRDLHAIEATRTHGEWHLTTC